jgi:nucleosome assembly protein 1-like 1
MLESSEFITSNTSNSTTPSKKNGMKTAAAATNPNPNLDDSLLDTAEKPNPLVQLLQLPKPILRRVNALKNLQLKMVDIESGFYDELHALECKYALKYETIFEKRKEIVSGSYEPNDDEAKWDYDDVLGEAAANTVDNFVVDDAAKNNGVDTLAESLNGVSLNNNTNNNKTGIPEFWLQAFKSSDLLCEMMQPHDEHVLRYLSDIKIIMHEQAPIGYTIEFYFNKNEYFTNEKLTKTYGLTTEKDKKDPLSYDGPVFYKCQGEFLKFFFF